MNEFELKKIHWQNCKQDNENLILQSKMQIVMAENILKMVEEKLKEFPETEAEKKLKEIQKKAQK